MKIINYILLIGICTTILFIIASMKISSNNKKYFHNTSSNNKIQLPLTKIEGAVVNLLEEKCDDRLFDEIFPHKIAGSEIINNAPAGIKSDFKAQKIRLLPVFQKNKVLSIITYPWHKWENPTKEQFIKIYDSNWSILENINVNLHYIYQAVCDLENNKLFVLSTSSVIEDEDGEMEILVYSLSSHKLLSSYNIKHARIDDDIYMLPVLNEVYLFYSSFYDMKTYIKEITSSSTKTIWERPYYRFGIFYPPKLSIDNKMIAFSVENDTDENYSLWLLERDTNKITRAVQSNTSLYSNIPYKWTSKNKLLFLSQQNQLVNWSLYELLLPN